MAAEILRGSDVAVCTVIGFPHGGHCTEIKVVEAELACSQGATELDMVALGAKLSERKAELLSESEKLT